MICDIKVEDVNCCCMMEVGHVCIGLDGKVVACWK